MEIKVTKEVTHRANSDYPCLLIQFEDKDKHFFAKDKNWMPKHQEIAMILEKMMEIEPEWREYQDEFIMAICRGVAKQNAIKPNKEEKLF